MLDSKLAFAANSPGGRGCSSMPHDATSVQLALLRPDGTGRQRRTSRYVAGSFAWHVGLHDALAQWQGGADFGSLADFAAHVHLSS